MCVNIIAYCTTRIITGMPGGRDLQSTRMWLEWKQWPLHCRVQTQHCAATQLLQSVFLGIKTVLFFAPLHAQRRHSSRCQRRGRGIRCPRRKKEEFHKAMKKSVVKKRRSLPTNEINVAQQMKEFDATIFSSRRQKVYIYWWLWL